MFSSPGKELHAFWVPKDASQLAWRHQSTNRRKLLLVIQKIENENPQVRPNTSLVYAYKASTSAGHTSSTSKSTVRTYSTNWNTVHLCKAGVRYVSTQAYACYVFASFTQKCNFDVWAQTQEHGNGKTSFLPGIRELKQTTTTTTTRTTPNKKINEQNNSWARVL